MPLRRIDPDAADTFDPLIEAVAFGGTNSHRIELTSDDVTARIIDCNVEGGSGDVFVVPESMATFLPLMGWGRLICP